MAKQVVLFDLGDTIMVEESEIKDDSQTTLQADLIPGMKALLLDLSSRGVPCGIVADTRPGTYRNVLLQHGLYDLFESFSISEELGVEKPHPLMFEDALEKHGLTADTAVQAMMVGNNYERDIRGAKARGLTTLWFHWNERYPVPEDAACADYTCTTPAEVMAAITEWLSVTTTNSNELLVEKRMS
ncbi:HAD family hydrolase [Alicyclobacillus fodiniaquatilis]|uniref:HAD family hydrolase n=1 Tax=Alicyclobacillus fodiniaquatilis TaxID=1661150 RepID=A0ABW4JIS7_9BACL